MFTQLNNYSWYRMQHNR